MGKGDRKSRRGKIILGSFGVRRPRKEVRRSIIEAAPAIKVEKIEVKPELKVTPPKKKLRTSSSMQ